MITKAEKKRVFETADQVEGITEPTAGDLFRDAVAQFRMVCGPAHVRIDREAIEMRARTTMPDGIQPRLVSSCRVKIVDLVSRERVYPPAGADSEYRTVRSLSDIMGLEKYNSEMGKRELQMHLAELTGQNVTKLFYKHRPNEIGSRLKP